MHPGEPSSDGKEPDLLYVEGEFWRRCVATVLDATLFVVTFVLGWLALVFALRGRGQSPGKFLMRLIVVDRQEVQPLSATKVAVRELGLKAIVGSLTSGISDLVGLFGYFFGNGPWWDRVWDTTVVRHARAAEIEYSAKRAHITRLDA